MKLLSDMPLFIGLANAQHFGRAAAALDIPASTLSRRISALEQELGLALVNRSTRTFALTEAGQMLYERGRRLLTEANRIREDLGEGEAALSGHIRIGLKQEIGQILFLPILAEFATTHPGVSFEVSAIPGQPSQSDGFDIALVVEHQIPLRDSSQRVRRLGSFPRLLFASKTYLKRAAPIHEPADLANHSCLRVASGVLQKEWELRRGKERRRIEVGGPFSASNIGLLTQLAREHQGITVLPQFLADHSAFGGGLVRVLPDWEAVPGHIVALTSDQIMPVKLVKLMEAIKVGVSQRLETLIPHKVNR